MESWWESLLLSNFILNFCPNSFLCDQPDWTQENYFLQGEKAKRIIEQNDKKRKGLSLI